MKFLKVISFYSLKILFFKYRRHRYLEVEITHKLRLFSHPYPYHWEAMNPWNVLKDGHLKVSI